jgi:hypothetical protein
MIGGGHHLVFSNTPDGYRPLSAEDDPLYADRRNFYKVEKWSKDGQRIAVEAPIRQRIRVLAGV